jgi:hypothetical protein
VSVSVHLESRVRSLGASDGRGDGEGISDGNFPDSGCEMAIVVYPTSENQLLCQFLENKIGDDGGVFEVIYMFLTKKECV